MNRFSSLSTLSKFKTAVRETVDFVIKNSVHLTSILVIATMALPAQSKEVRSTYVQSTPERIRECRTNFAAAKTAANALSDAQAKKDALEAAQDDLDRCLPPKQENANSRRCEESANKLEELGTKATASCSKIKSGMGLLDCRVKIETCRKTESDLDELFEEDEGGRENYCNKMLANACPAIPDFNTGRDYREEKKDSERDRKEAKKLVDELTQDQNDLKKDLVKQQRELQEEQMKAAYAARQAEREVANEMKEALAGISEQQKKAFADAQKAYTAMDADYISMRAQIRQAADAVAQAEDELQTTCRAAAEKKYMEAEKIRLAELKARSKNVGSNVSGSTARRKSATARARNIDYTAFLSECTSGSSAEGVSARNRIKAAQRQKDSTEKILNEKALLIEKQRSTILKQLQDMEGDATNQQSKVVEQVNEKLTAMNEKQQLTAQLNQQRITEFQQNQSSTMASIQQKLMTANQELMETQKEASLATTRLSCQGTSGQRSESLREKFAEGFSSYGLIDEAQNKCKTFTASCPTVATPSVCSIFDKKFEEAMKKAVPHDVESRSGKSAR